MAYDPRRHHRRSIRLRGYDYAAPGYYFVTLCVQGRCCVLGEVRGGRVVLSPVGRIVDDAWRWLAVQYPYVRLDAWVIMPNHLHGILVLRDGTGAADRKSLGRLIGAFKTRSTAEINRVWHTAGASFWQRNYWEHIVRDEEELARIRAYIADNPARWTGDSLRVP